MFGSFSYKSHRASRKMHQSKMNHKIGIISVIVLVSISYISAIDMGTMAQLAIAASKKGSPTQNTQTQHPPVAANPSLANLMQIASSTGLVPPQAQPLLQNVGQPAVQPGVQPLGQPGIQPGVQPLGQPAVQTGVQPKGANVQSMFNVPQPASVNPQ